MITGVAKGEASSLSKADGVRVIIRALLPVCFQVPCKRLIPGCLRYKVQIEKKLFQAVKRAMLLILSLPF